MVQSSQALARQYRPTSFKDLIGQRILVETLTREIETGRVKQAYLLTGVRGVGKTTSARIIARGLNCEKGPTADPCGTCAQCRAIAEDRHLDVVEMDAASNTGVDDMRKVIENVPYKPVQGRIKVYIIDEIHMLSKSAFNSLLKTLEEPPAHVVFIFATTELNKVPATVISRCERFDLKRVPVDVLSGHLMRIASSEHRDIEPAAAQILARASEGSVRDAMSLLDKALSNGEGRIGAEACRQMIGLADRSRIFDLLAECLAGKSLSALRILRNLVADGAEPVNLVADLLDAVHLSASIAISPETAKDPGLSADEASKGAAIARSAGYARISAAWQLLIKAVEEVRGAPDSSSALDMVVLRVCAANAAKS